MEDIHPIQLGLDTGLVLRVGVPVPSQGDLDPTSSMGNMYFPFLNVP